MREGVVVESGPADPLLHVPRHPYTRRLIAAVPSARTRGRRLAPDIDLPVPAAPDRGPAPLPPHGGPVLEVRNVSKAFRLPGGDHLRAVDDVSFALERGTTIGVVGGFGLREEHHRADRPRARGSRRRRGPAARPPVAAAAPDGRRLPGPAQLVRPAGPPDLAEREARVRELLDQVGLPGAVLDRFPLRMSGGQRQRIAIARALASPPDVIVLDEAVSALDVSIQAQILDLLVQLQRHLAVSYLFIAHDLGVISHLSDVVLVMKDGAVVERGTPEDVLDRPEHPYTQQLVGALPAVPV